MSSTSGMPALPSVGEEICGFTVTEIRDYPVLDAKAVFMEHKRTRAKLVWVANDDTNRTFSVTFRTIDPSDKGIPHVFEHAALSGSVRYPDPSLFFSMISGTYQTFLNAMTGQACTIFPCSSLSEAQLLRFADVYLSGVYEPLVLTDINAMRREACRRELKSAEDKLTLTGTVYTEMQGNYSENERYYDQARALYPNSIWSSVTGGVPEEIEKMTQQDLIDFHDRYYHPSNSLTVLYGDLDPAPFLKLLDEQYFRGYGYRETCTDDPRYEPFRGFSEVTYETAASADAAPRRDILYALSLPGLSRTEGSLAALLISALSDPASHLSESMRAAFPGCSFECSLPTDTPYPMLIAELQNAGDADEKAFAERFRAALSETLEEGLSLEFMRGVASAVRKVLDTAREDRNVGLNTVQSFSMAFAVTGDPASALNETEAVLNGMDDYVEKGGAEATLRRFIAAEDSRLVVTQAVPGLAERREQERQERIAALQASMTPEQLAQTVRDTEEFDAWTAANEKLSMISSVKAVSAASLPEEVHSCTARDERVEGMRVLSCPVEGKSLTRLSLYFSAAHVPASDLHRLALAASEIVCTLNTGTLSRSALNALYARYCMDSTLTTFHQESTGGFRPYYEMNLECLGPELPDAFKAVQSILTDTRADDIDYLRHDIASYLDDKRQSAAASPHGIAMSFGNAALFPSSRWSYETSCLPYFEYLEGLLKLDDEGLKKEAEAALEVFRTLLFKDGFILCAAGSSENIRRTAQCALPLFRTLDDAPRADAEFNLPLLPRRIGVSIPGGVSYNLLVGSMRTMGQTFNARMNAVDSFLYDTVLIPVMRYRNGVYSPLNATRRLVSYILAYRDPDVTTTFDKVIPTLSDALRSTELTPEQAEGYILRSYSSLAMPVPPFAAARRAFDDVLTGRDSAKERLDGMRALKSFTRADCEKTAPLYDALLREGARVSAGPAAVLQENRSRYDFITDWYIS